MSEFGFPEIDVAAAPAVGKKVLGGYRDQSWLQAASFGWQKVDPSAAAFDSQKTQCPTAHKKQPQCSLIQ